MKPIFTTFAALTLATGLALAGSAATADSNKITYTQNGTTWSTSNNISVFGSNGRDRSYSEHRHAGHFGAPFLGSYGRDGTYNKPVYDALRANDRRSKTQVDLGSN